MKNEALLGVFAKTPDLMKTTLVDLEDGRGVVIVVVTAPTVLLCQRCPAATAKLKTLRDKKTLQECRPPGVQHGTMVTCRLVEIYLLYKICDDCQIRVNTVSSPSNTCAMKMLTSSRTE